MRHLARRIACIAALLGAAGPALAQEATPPSGVFLAENWPVASDDELDSLRGGYDLGSSLSVSFGFIRNVSINGDLVSQTRFTLPDLSHITTDQARMVADALAQVQLVQNGTGNSVGVTAASGGLAGGTVVQNSLNNQLIQTQTIINAGVNSLGLIHALNAQGTLRDALTGALGLH